VEAKRLQQLRIDQLPLPPLMARIGQRLDPLFIACRLPLQLDDCGLDGGVETGAYV
jgi:hypothetical protein